MILIINVLTYLIGLSWIAFGVLGIIDPEIFTEMGRGEFAHGCQTIATLDAEISSNHNKNL